jgi:hypothetical protein
VSVRVGTTDRAITAFGGAELLREAARAVGLAPALDDCLQLNRRARGLSDTEFVVSMAESTALGASCLDDLAVTRADAAQAEALATDPRALVRLLRRQWVLRVAGGQPWLRQLVHGLEGGEKALDVGDRCSAHGGTPALP